MAGDLQHQIAGHGYHRSVILKIAQRRKDAASTERNPDGNGFDTRLIIRRNLEYV
jgi:hypothetical protein